MKHYLVVFCCLLFTLTGSTQWLQTNGPYGGIISDVEIFGNKVFAVTSTNGVYVSVDNGISWTSANASFPYDLGIYIKAITAYGGNLYATSGSSASTGSLYMSVDSGNSWVAKYTNQVTSMAFSDSAIFVGHFGGTIDVSANNGNSWTTQNVTGSNGNEIKTLGTMRSNVFAGADSSIYVSHDNGINWQTSFVGDYYFFTNSYEFIGNDFFVSTTEGVMLSSDSGTIWQNLDIGPLTSAYDGVATTLKANGSTLVVCNAYGIKYLTKSGGTWALTDSSLTNDVVSGFAVNGSTFFAGTTNEGMKLSTDSGSTWISSNDGLIGSDILEISAIGATLIAHSSNDGLYRSDDGGNSWIRLITPDAGPYHTDINSFAIFDSTIYICSAASIFESNDLGNSWTHIQNNLPSSWTNSNCFAKCGSNLLVGVEFGGLYFTKDNGATWTQSNFTNSVSAVSTIDSIVYVSSNNITGVYMSTDSGQTFSLSTLQYLPSLKIDSNLFALGYPMYVSHDNGNSWTSVIDGRELTTDGTNVFATTYSNGVYVSPNNGYSWISTLEPLVSTSIAIGSGNVFAGTYGGVWKRQISEMLNYSSVKGKCFIDYNNNDNQDLGEPGFHNAFVRSVGSPQTISSQPNNNGIFINSLPDTGNIQTSVTGLPPAYSATPSGHSSDFTTYYQVDSVNFAIYPTPGFRDIRICLFPTTAFRLGNNVTYRITFSNLGTDTVVSGDVYIVKDSRLVFISSSVGYSSLSGDTISWAYTNLLPLEERTVDIVFNVPAAPIVNPGDILSSSAVLEPLLPNYDSNNNYAYVKSTARGAYDPNEKICLFGDYISMPQIMNGQYLTYVIHFQNTGNDTATTIVVKDTLDSNLDVSSFEVISVSHPFTVSIINDRYITFTFNNIQLPDSSINDSLSHGYIVYKIKPKSSVLDGAQILNIADIYFDANAPIATNTSIVTVEFQTAVTEIQIKDELLFPNPTSHQLTIPMSYFQNKEVTFSILNVIGQIAIAPSTFQIGGESASIDVSNLNAGVYFLQLKSDSGTLIKRFVKE